MPRQRRVYDPTTHTAVPVTRWHDDPWGEKRIVPLEEPRVNPLRATGPQACTDCPSCQAGTPPRAPRKVPGPAGTTYYEATRCPCNHLTCGIQPLQGFPHPQRLRITPLPTRHAHDDPWPITLLIGTLILILLATLLYRLFTTP